MWNFVFSRRLLWFGCALVLTPLAAYSADEPPRDEYPPVLATVNGIPIYERQVERLVDRTLRGRKPSDTERKALRTEALRRLVDRELVLSYLKRAGRRVAAAEVDLAVSRLASGLEQQQRTLDEYLAEQQMSRAMLRREIIWQLNWQRACATHLTDANLQRHFERNRRDFDGTQLRVAHIVIKTSQEAAQRRRARERLERLRRDLIEGKTTFSDAARAVSQGPSAEEGGVLGWIRRAGPMSPEFSQAAFALDPDEISQPVTTRAGVHLIRCLEVKPGQRAWTDVRRELEQSAVKYLFRWMADRERPQAEVDYEPAARR